MTSVIRCNTKSAIVNAVRAMALFSYHFVVAVWKAKAAQSGSVNYWEITLVILATLLTPIALPEDFVGRTLLKKRRER